MTRPARDYEPDPLAVLRAALARGPLTRVGPHWRFGRRLFSSELVNRLITRGEAIRRADVCVVAPCEAAP